MSSTINRRRRAAGLLRAILCIVAVAVLSTTSIAFAADLEINAVEFPTEGHDNGYDRGAAGRVDSPLRVDSTRDLVDKVLARLKEGDCIKTLNIYGHGSPGRISTGKGNAPPDKTNRNAYIDGQGDAANDASWTPELTRLKGKFCKNAVVNLYGCNVGADEAGAAKVWALAKLLGVKVGAAVNKVDGNSDYPAHTDKNWQEASPDGEKPTAKASTG
jgi:hypothetical protein